MDNGSESDIDVGPKQHCDDIVTADGADFLRQRDGCPDCCLFLCWPRDADEMVEAFKGSVIVWIGEPDGCTWAPDEDTFAEWERDGSCAIPTWPGMHDVLWCLRRKAGSDFAGHGVVTM